MEEVGWARGAGQQAGGLSPLLPLPSLSLSRHKSKLQTPDAFIHSLLSLSRSPLGLSLSLTSCGDSTVCRAARNPAKTKKNREAWAADYLMMTNPDPDLISNY